MSKYLYISLFIIAMINKSFSQDNLELSKIKPYSITFSVENIEKMTDWYSNNLGFKKVKEKEYSEFNTYLIFLELNGYRVELIKDYDAVPKITNPKSPQRHTGVWGQTQFCFYTEDLEKVKQELINKNVSVDWEYENKDLGVKFFFIKDPEGNMIQFLQEMNTTKNNDQTKKTMNTTKSTIGKQFLNEYATGLINADAQKMASLFHSGLSYIVNDEVREGAADLCKEETWNFIFSKVKFLKAEAGHVIEVHPGHIFYHEYLQVKNKKTGEIKEGHFGDESIINKNGKMLLVNRIADNAYFKWFGETLSN
ncbi:hypothetical protein F7018_09120 [Tenacibaculum aiptasiae]|uniref:VOC domain-containing protein n=1 Tax=Tenacibaculum aiptasiae TaxID=426481 RepID=A0A7J5ALC3_9FLAO|nr:VOC family protein [Tenacibaculum aiptasiae]KAB1158333.1 hypothetical protein F7018_09120 [Tenacibaculum aiptasiae]